MPQIKIIVQKTQSQTGVTGTYNGTEISLDGALCVSAQLVVSSISGASSCTGKLQISNDPPGATPTNWNDYGSSQNITANGNLFFNPADFPPPGNWVRRVIAAPTGSFTISDTFVVKGPN